MKIVPYAEWSRRPRGATATSHPIGSTIYGVTLHWEGPHMGVFDHTRCADKVRGIQGYHRDHHNWADIAYNLLACPHGWVFEGRGAGVTSAANGDTGSNATWYAVCYLGGEGDGFTDDGKQAMRDAVAYLRGKGNAGPRVNGHRDHKGTQCPGETIYRWLNSTDFSTPQEDDMAFTDWPQKDQDALVQAVAAEVARIPVNVIGEKGATIGLRFAQARTLHAARTAAALETTGANDIAAAVVKALPQGRIDEATVAAGVRRALAELLAEEE